MFDLAKAVFDMAVANKLSVQAETTRLTFYGKGQFGTDKTGQANIQSYQIACGSCVKRKLGRIYLMEMRDSTFWDFRRNLAGHTSRRNLRLQARMAIVEDYNGIANMGHDGSDLHEWIRDVRSKKHKGLPLPPTKE